MYPHVNGVGGTNGAGNSRQSNGTTGRQESSSQEPSIFSRKMSNARATAEEASQKTQQHMDRVKHYINQGYTYAQAIEAAEQEEGGPVNREQLVERLVKQGYDRETAERAIPRNIDQRIDYAREKGRIEGQRKVDELDQKLNGIRRR